MVISTWPDTFAIIEPTRDPVVIEFSERISERPTTGSLQDAVVVSPETGAYEVKHKRAGLEISLGGGFRPGLVYRVRVQNTVKDMFNNRLEAPFELVFSTGGAFEDNVLAGIVTDRITGEKVEQARVEARPVPEGEEGPPAEEGGTPEREEPDTVPVYVARTDTAGIYIIRYLPPGRYDITVYQDNNRNREPDFRESQGTAAATLGLLPPRKDTIVDEVALLRPDTTPAELMRAEAVDSSAILLTFDDYLPAGTSLSRARVLLSLGEEGEPQRVHRLLWPNQMDSLRAHNDSVKAAAEEARTLDSLRVVADSLETVVRDLRAAAADSTEILDVERVLERLQNRLAPPEPEEEPAEPAAEPAPPKPILPQQEIYGVLDFDLLPDTTYKVTVVGIRNVNGLDGGGGEAEFTWEPPEPAEEESQRGRRGTTGRQSDTGVVSPPDTAASPDSIRISPDTTVTPPDTTVTPPDTTSVPPDTTVVPPDTARVRPARIRGVWLHSSRSRGGP